jgi:hypothetical protein
MDGSGWDSEDTVTGICILKNQTVMRESERETQQKIRIILDEEVLKFIEKVGSI